MEHSSILIAEDERATAVYLDEYLTSQNFNVSGVVSTGEKAVELACELHPDLILMDIMLEGKIDGIQAAHSIQDIFDIPIIYLTAYCTDDLSRRAIETNPYGYILKPFNINELKVNIDLALTQHRAKLTRMHVQTSLEQQLRICIDCYEYLTCTQKCDLYFQEEFDPDEERVRAREKKLDELNAELKRNIKRYAEEKLAVLSGEKSRSVPSEEEFLRQEIWERERRFRDIVDLLPGGIVEMDADLNLTFANKAGLELFGYSEQDLKNGLKGLDLLHPDDLKKASQRIAKYYTERTQPPTKYRVIKKDGTVAPVLFKATPVIEDGQVTGFRASITDISRLDRMEEELKESERRHREMLEGLNDVVYRMSIPDGKYEYVSKAAKEVFGYDSQVLLNNPLYIRHKIHPDYEDYFNKKWQELLNGIVPETYEYKITGPDGEERWILQSNRGIFDENGRLIAIEGLCRNISRQKESVDSIQRSLREKETLLQEIHHRVKNNMTVVASLLKLQVSAATNAETKAALKDSQSRLETMSLIHEFLYRSDSYAALDIKKYLTDLCIIIHQGYNHGGNTLLRIEAEHALIGVKQVSSMGLIVNELLTNALKYAFPGGEEGEIVVSFRMIGENEAELTVSDNGIGFAEKEAFENTSSLGLSLVKTITENQLEGSLEMDNRNGTRITVRFPVDGE